ncbi:MAG: hypothetical protein IPO53_15380 [Chitinophagaceae bacterium]|nr:hypothetical protein [Chitinophagaceae bacterium]
MGRLKTKQLVIFSGLTLLSFISCNKEDTITPTKTLEQLLTGKTWKADEIRAQLSNNTASYYKRGTVGTTYDSDSLKFAVNNTGHLLFLRISIFYYMEFFRCRQNKDDFSNKSTPYTHYYLY